MGHTIYRLAWVPIFGLGLLCTALLFSTPANPLQNLQRMGFDWQASLVHLVMPRTPTTRAVILTVDDDTIVRHGAWVVSENGIQTLEQKVDDAGAVFVRSNLAQDTSHLSNITFKGDIALAEKYAVSKHEPGRAALIVSTHAGLVPSLALQSMLAGYDNASVTIAAEEVDFWANFEPGIRSLSFGGKTWRTASDGSVSLLSPSIFPAVSAYSASGVLNDEPAVTALLKNASVFIVRANTLPSSSPLWAQAQAAAQLQAGHMLQRPLWAPLLEATLLFVLGGVLIGLIHFNKVRWSLAMLATTIIGFAILSTGAYAGFAVLVDWLSPSLCLILCFGIAAATLEFRRSRMRDWLTRRMGAEPPHHLVQSMLLDPNQEPLANQSKEVTVLVVQLRGTMKLAGTFREKPALFARQLKKTMNMASDIARAHGATFDRRCGDTLIAYWNAPLDEKKHALKACECSLAILSRMEPLNETLESELSELGEAFTPLQVSMGIETGPAIICQTGDANAGDYSLFGDPLERALLLAESAPIYGPAILVGKANSLLTQKSFALLEIDRIGKRGSKKYRTVYALLGSPVLRVNPRFKALQEGLGTFLKVYRHGQFDMAAKLLKQCSKLPGMNAQMLALYEARLAYLKDHPPSPDWNGRIDPPIK